MCLDYPKALKALDLPTRSLTIILVCLPRFV